MSFCRQDTAYNKRTSCEEVIRPAQIRGMLQRALAACSGYVCDTLRDFFTIACARLQDRDCCDFTASGNHYDQPMASEARSLDFYCKTKFYCWI